MTLRRRLELAWAGVEGRDCLRIRGWTSDELRELGAVPAAELARRLRVLPSELVKTSDTSALQPMAGQFEVRQDVVCFVPRFPFLSGTSYTVLVDWAPGDSGGRGLETWALERPGRAATPATTVVVAIYPSTDDLPVNQLKLYVHFSNPMSEGCAARAVHVGRADNGDTLKDVFLSMEPELWDRERRRLTLLLDPGRIKRGLVPNQEAGYPLIEGVPILVRVDAAFRDAQGLPLQAAAERRFTVGPPVRDRVDPARWRCLPPTAASRGPLTLEFDRSLDHALLQHSLWVNDAAGRPLAGDGVVGTGEWSWRFTPESPWSEGRHAVTVDPHLEDLAGNSLIRVFDRDLTRPEDAPSVARSLAVRFTCTP